MGAPFTGLASAGAWCNMLLLLSRVASLQAVTALPTAIGRDLMSMDGAYGADGEVEQMHSDEECETGMAFGTIGAVPVTVICRSITTPYESYVLLLIMC